MSKFLVSTIMSFALVISMAGLITVVCADEIPAPNCREVDDTDPQNPTGKKCATPVGQECVDPTPECKYKWSPNGVTKWCECQAA